MPGAGDPDMNNTLDLKSFFSGKRIVVTGAAGTVGADIVRRLHELDAAEIRALDNHEGDMFTLDTEFMSDKRVQVFMCDIRSEERLNSLFTGMDYVFHAAALKHVPFCEKSPFETVQTNINGVQNVIRCAIAQKVKKVLFTSSDKAVNPTNVMGTSKLMGERLMTAANALNDNADDIIFVSTRFGNVAGSKGSVIPLFCEQIRRGGPVTLTDSEMTRFVMSLTEATRLVLKSMVLACGGEVFVTKMPVLRIIDLAEVLIDLIAPLGGHKASDITIDVIGSRPGEKIYEELTTHEEIRRTQELEEMFVVTPAFRNIYGKVEYEYRGFQPQNVAQVYNSSSEPFMTKSEIEAFLRQPGVLPPDIQGALR
ncbi:MAG: polysaccharide biosynthesis protein [Alphaproteobacteria bacterium]